MVLSPMTDLRRRAATRGLANPLHAADEAEGRADSAIERPFLSEQTAALEMLDRVSRRRWAKPIMLAADRGYNADGFLFDPEGREIKPHMARWARITKAKTPDGDSRRRMRARTRTVGCAIGPR